MFLWLWTTEKKMVAPKTLHRRTQIRHYRVFIRSLHPSLVVRFPTDDVDRQSAITCCNFSVSAIVCCCVRSFQVVNFIVDRRNNVSFTTISTHHEELSLRRPHAITKSFVVHRRSLKIDKRKKWTFACAMKWIIPSFCRLISRLFVCSFDRHFLLSKWILRFQLTFVFNSIRTEKEIYFFKVVAQFKANYSSLFSIEH